MVKKQNKQYMWSTLTSLLRIYSQPQNLGVRFLVVVCSGAENYLVYVICLRVQVVGLN